MQQSERKVSQGCVCPGKRVTFVWRLSLLSYSLRSLRGMRIKYCHDFVCIKYQCFFKVFVFVVLISATRGWSAAQSREDNMLSYFHVFQIISPCGQHKCVSNSTVTSVLCQELYFRWKKVYISEIFVPEKHLFCFMTDFCLCLSFTVMWAHFCWEKACSSISVCFSNIWISI